jgi:hypothetical protein
MIATALVFGGSAGAAEDGTRLLTDFSASSEVRWTTVNDNVMGGRSKGGFRIDGGVLRFEGATNTRGGGFSSIRSRPIQLGLRGFDGIRLRVKADGRRYTFRLTTSTTSRMRGRPSYWADFETKAGGEWQVIDVPFSRFSPRWRGRTLSGPALDTNAIDSLGLMIYDKLDGAFRMDVDWIKAYRKESAFSMSRYQGRNRPLLVFAPRSDDARLIAQLAVIRTSRRKFDDRDMQLIVVTGDGASRAEDRPLSKADGARLRLEYGVSADKFAVRLVGKDGGVKRTSDRIVDLDEIYALIDGMPMRKQEMRARGS